MPFEKRSTWFRLMAVGLPFNKASDARRRSFAGLAVLGTLLLTVNAMNVVNSYMGRNFMTALANRETLRFFAFAGILASVFAASTVVEVLSRYSEQRLGLMWREWLTRRFIERYLADRAYFRLADRHEIDNPDERISLDIQTFTTTTLSIVIMVFNGIVTLAAFSWVLWSITPWLFLVAYGYASIGCVGTILLARRLTALNNKQIQKEADFRYCLGRLRENAGAIAKSAGEAERKTDLFAGLKSLVQNFLDVIRVNRNLGFFITAFNYMPQIIPAMIVAPLYFRGAVQFGAVTQAAMAFAQVQGVFSIFENQVQSLTVFAAVSRRLSALWEATEVSLPSSATPEPPGNAQ